MNSFCHIVIVDDEFEMKEIFEFHFTSEIESGKCRISYFQSGEECLKFLTSKDASDVALVVSDVNMPGMSGFMLIETIRKKYSHIKTFLCSAYDTERHRATGKEAGALEYVPKPVEFDDLKKLISKHCHARISA